MHLIDRHETHHITEMTFAFCQLESSAERAPSYGEKRDPRRRRKVGRVRCRIAQVLPPGHRSARIRLQKPHLRSYTMDANG